MGGAEASSETASANAGAAGEPGFEQSGSSTGADSSLPDMRDALPTFDDAYGAESSETTASASSAAGNGTDANPADGDSETSGMSGSNGTSASEGSGSDSGSDNGSDNGSLGTRAEGGLEGFGNGQGTLTAAEQVAILDRQLEQSTGEFDGLILAEQNKQRELERERTTQQTQTSGSAENASGGDSGGSYGSESGIGGAASGGGMAGGGIGGGRGMPPANPAIYAPPEDIPEGSDDDVVARQLREAAMREADPEVREKLWVEYRKYKGIEAPE